MAVLAFTAYGVHCFALGLARAFAGDPRRNEFTAMAFAVISVLGMVILFKEDDWPVGLVFRRPDRRLCQRFLAGTSIRMISGAPAAPTALNLLGARALGSFRLATVPG